MLIMNASISQKKTNARNKSLLELHTDVQAISSSFLEEFSLGIMNMIRVDKEGRSTYLCDNFHWLKNYLDNRYPDVGACENNSDLNGSDHFLWSSFSDDDPVVIDSRKFFSLQHGITMVERNDNGTVDYFNYGVTNSNPGEKDRLTRMIPDLQRFQKMFYDKGEKLFTQANENAYLLRPLESLEGINKKVPKRFHLGPQFSYQYLTDKELQCLYWLIRGKTLPEISIILAMSERTAEKHIENVKRKLNCHTQCEIGYIVGKSGIDSYW